MVPVKFVVPHGDDAWPEAAWGYPLGKHAEWLRKQWREGGHRMVPKQREELEEMEFAWDRNQYKWDRFVLPALRKFYDFNGHTDVLKDFRIPKGSPEWPDHLWGQRLGIKVGNIRSRGDFAKQVRVDEDELKRLNFCHDSTLYDRDWREKVVPALRAFHKEFGHCNVSATFTVPSQFPWPAAAWGMRLGKTVLQIRCGNTGANQDKRELEELSFVWDHSESEWSDRILPALETFHRLNGHCRVPQSFEVPSDESWSTLSWGLKLGNIVSSIRSRDSYSTQVMRDTARLEELGFVWDHFESEWSERILPALETFNCLNGHCRVSASFVVPSDENWPTPIWGLRLGKFVSRIRSRDSYSTQVMRDKAHLEDLGFVWDFYESEWSERILPALENFYRLMGHCQVPQSFAVPSDECWPTLSWGLKLGNVVSGIRSDGSYSTQVMRDKTRLKELGFVWDFFESEWSKRIMPALEAFHQLHGHCRVSRSFVVPSEATWPENAHGLKLGIIVGTIHRSASHFDQIARSMNSLAAIEFDSKIAVSKWKNRVEPILTTFEQLYGHRNVPRDFVVPSTPPWQKKDWGIQLGKLEPR
ncbi:hypothetical protein PR003_g14671 [Phytophthora rubi]|uniref:Helicase-associated domain-containing protein n=1 Tax=Phytophthora rubi TaxID=129364 RepID=A0A6A4FDB1_9STRA|nr:hypothetical protein PR003_g14671 [Phytophthora rubi]